jgi:hypothetical protein
MRIGLREFIRQVATKITVKIIVMRPHKGLEKSSEQTDSELLKSRNSLRKRLPSKGKLVTVRTGIFSKAEKS